MLQISSLVFSLFHFVCPDKSKFQNKSRVTSGAKSKSSNGRGSSGGSATSPETPTAQDQPVAPPIAPRLMKTTPYEFCQAWNSLKPCQGVQPYAEILRQISPGDLPSGGFVSLFPNVVFNN